MITRRGSGIRPTVYSWWFGKRIVRKRWPGVYAHIARSDCKAIARIYRFWEFCWWSAFLCRLRGELSSSIPDFIVAAVSVVRW